MLKRELEKALEEILTALAPQIRANPLAGVMIGQLKAYLGSMPEEKAREIARQMVALGKRLEEALEKAQG